MVTDSLWQEQAKAEEEACLRDRSDYLSESGIIYPCIGARAIGGREAATGGTWHAVVERSGNWSC